MHSLYFLIFLVFATWLHCQFCFHYAFSISCTAYIMCSYLLHSIHHMLLTLFASMSCALYIMYPVSCTTDIMSSLHNVLPTPYTLYTTCSLHCIIYTSCAPYIIYTTHCVLSTSMLPTSSKQRVHGSVLGITRVKKIYKYCLS